MRRTKNNDFLLRRREFLRSIKKGGFLLKILRREFLKKPKEHNLPLKRREISRRMKEVDLPLRRRLFSIGKKKCDFPLRREFSKRISFPKKNF